MDKIGDYIIPILIFIIVAFGFIRKVPIFDTFVKGAKDGLVATYSISASLIGLVTAVTMLKSSGALDMIITFLSPLANLIKIPEQLIPLMLLKPVSGSGSTALLTQILSDNGVNSFCGRAAAVIAGSTETTFYAIAVYYGSVGVKNIRHTLAAAILADIASMITAIITVRLFFG
ncbi:MAG: nucleoside recognition domain-containing protein [Acutalibacteraceae bacterium]